MVPKPKKQQVIKNAKYRRSTDTKGDMEEKRSILVNRFDNCGGEVILKYQSSGSVSYFFADPDPYFTYPNLLAIVNKTTTLQMKSSQKGKYIPLVIKVKKKYVCRTSYCQFGNIIF